MPTPLHAAEDQAAGDVVDTGQPHGGGHPDHAPVAASHY